MTSSLYSFTHPEMGNAPPIFEFTYGGQRFEIFEQGAIYVEPSALGPDAVVIINRIPARFAND